MNEAGGNDPYWMEHEYSSPQERLPFAHPPTYNAPDRNPMSRCSARSTWGPTPRQPASGGWPSSWTAHGCWNPQPNPLGLPHTFQPAPPQWPMQGPVLHTGGLPPRPSGARSLGQDYSLQNVAQTHRDHSRQIPTANVTQPIFASAHASAASREMAPVHAAQHRARQDHPTRPPDDVAISTTSRVPNHPDAHVFSDTDQGTSGNEAQDVVASSTATSAHAVPPDRSQRPSDPGHQPVGPMSDGEHAASSSGSAFGGDGGWPSPRRPRPMAEVPHAFMTTARAGQVMRGLMSRQKKVASKRVVHSLLDVKLDSLPDDEKTCIICYIDFGEPSPEGTVEKPVRLPKCKHVFGEKCLVKWLEESALCPYCRDKLESQRARPSDATLRRMWQEAVAADQELLMEERSAMHRPGTERRAFEPINVSARALAPSYRNHDHEVNRDSTAANARQGRVSQGPLPGAGNERWPGRDASQDQSHPTYIRTPAPQPGPHVELSPRIVEPPVVQMLPRYSFQAPLNPQQPPALHNTAPSPLFPLPQPPSNFDQRPHQLFPPIRLPDNYSQHRGPPPLVPFYSASEPFAIPNQQQGVLAPYPGATQYPHPPSNTAAQLPGFPEVFHQISYLQQAGVSSAHPPQPQLPANYELGGALGPPSASGHF